MSASNFYPQYALISGITQAQYAVATFTADHDFTPGEIISFRVSKPYGMIEINNQQARVLSITNTTVTVDIDSTQYTPFITPAAADVVDVAMAVPVGSGIIPSSNPVTINLQDAFDNVPVD